MKKTFSAILLAILLICFVACDANSVGSPSESGGTGAFSIGSKRYATLQEAVNALASKSASKDASADYTIKLTANVSDEGAVIFGISAEIKIDFGSYTYTLTNSSTGITIESNNSGVQISGGTIAYGSGNSFSSVITAKGDAAIRDMKIDVSSSDVDAIASSGGTLEIAGSSTIKTKDERNAFAVSGTGLIKTQSDSVAVTGGLSLKGNGTINLNRGTFSLGAMTIEGDSTTLARSSSINISAIDSSHDSDLESFNNNVQEVEVESDDEDWDNSMAYMFIDTTTSSETASLKLNSDYKKYSGNITVPNKFNGKTVTSIGYKAFYECTGLTSITIPDSVTSIGEFAFYGCTSLTDITIGDSVTSIGVSAFYDCTSLQNVYVSDLSSWLKIDFAASYANPMCLANNLYVGGELLSGDITIPSDVTSIGNRAFYGCSSLTSITIPSSATSIGDYAFEYCTSLTSITIPDSVTSIGERAFYYCTSLTSITIPDSVTSIGDDAFRYCTSLTSITIPDLVTSIGYHAFYGCSSLTSITIPDSVTSIGDYAFRYCQSLTRITIPSSVTYIGWGALYGCTSLTKINVNELNPNYSSEGAVLYNKNKTQLLSYSAAKGSITIPNSVTSIGDYAFECCTSLTSITIPDSVTSIGDYAFEDCTSLTSINIPDSVTSIGYSAFYNCKSLTSINIPDSVTSIGKYAFYGCSSLTKINVNELNPNYSSEGAVLYNKNKTHLLSGTAAGNITIPDSVTSIGEFAFDGCTSLTGITIPDSVTSIASYAFYNCTSLKSISFNGTRAKWNNVAKGSNWNTNVPATTVQCTDGSVSI